MDNIYDEITNLYTKGGFFTRYSGDFWITAILCLAVFVIVSYYWVISSRQPIIDDWVNQRCKPAVIPFAGMINAPDGKSSFEYTGENFEYCVQNIVQDIGQIALTPIYYLINIVTSHLQGISDSINSARGMSNNLRISISAQGNDLYNRLLGVTMPIVFMMRKISAIIGKTQGTLISGLYTLYGAFITTESSFLFIYELVVKLLWIIYSFIIACFAIGWMFPPTLAAGLSAVSFLSVLLIPVVMFILTMNSVSGTFSKSNMKSPPPIPKLGKKLGFCFAGETKIKTKLNRDVMIKDIKLGQELFDGSVVTALMKSTSSGSSFYSVCGIIVTGTHKIYEENVGWINVSQHSKCVPIKNFNEQYIYCIGTSSKIIKIDELVFSDWDEINDDILEKLGANSKHIHSNILNRYDIHKYFDVGIHPDTMIQLGNGRKIPIKEIEVNDVLSAGEIVETVITVKTDDIEEFCNVTTHDGSFIISATKNTELIMNDELVRNQVEPPSICYHLITNIGGFVAAGAFVSDYNRGIDQFVY